MSDEIPNNVPNTTAREQFKRADALFDAALDLKSAERVAYVKAQTAHDPDLQDHVIALLKAYDRSSEFLETPAVSDGFMARLQGVLGAPYQLRRRLAVGGMASVYLAHDVRHDRPVAIKVFVSDADEFLSGAPSVERFLSEIRVMARLQHPNVLPLFDSGASNGLLYFVMPYVNGETLRERLQHGSPLPLDEALRITHAIANAVQHAHNEGIVHRDLKPANVLLRDGQPLVADFGIALALAERNEKRLTQSGVVIGTVQYMSPEQAAGDQAVDARTDVYSLGAVLYEMLVGDPPHVASTSQGVLAKVRAERATSVHLLRDTIPLALSQVIDRALAKRPADRFPSMREFESALTTATQTPASVAAVGAAAIGTQESETKRSAERSRGRLFKTLVAGAVFIAIAAAATFVWTRNSETPTAASRFVVAPLADAAIGRPPSITPDGASLVYAGSAETGRRLFVRNVNQLTARALPGTEGALNTFVSPDGQWIGFISDDDKLQKVPLAGGAPTVLGGVFRYSDAAWLDNNRIIVASYGQQGLSWTSGGSGGLHQLTRLDTLHRDSGHGRPFVLPDARTVVFLISHDRTGPGPEPGELATLSLDTTATTPQTFARLGIQSLGAVGFVDGWLLYVAPDGGGLMAVQFDAASHTVRGQSVRVLEQDDGGIDVAAVASNGTLLYTRARESNMPLLVDSAGTAKPLLQDVTGSFMNPRLSPDGKRVAVQVTSKRGNDIWIYDIASSTPLHVTESGSAVGPTWTPDGKQVVFFSTQGGKDAAWLASTNGSTPPAPLFSVDGMFGLSVSNDGHQLIFQRMIGGVWSIWHADIAGDKIPHAFIAEKYDAFMPSLSPDGKWIAYAANESGRYEIYLRPFPESGAAVQVSHNGGSEPAWSRDGRKLFFRGDRRMYEAAITANGAGLSVSGIHVLFTDAFDGDMPMPHRNYDITNGGQQFVMIGAARDAAPQTIVVLNWLHELREKLAVAK